jgi:hypothetical protein
MDNFKKASQLKLRFVTNKGVLSVEQLWDLTPTQLATLVRSIKEELKSANVDDELSFLSDSIPTKGDIENQLRFEIAKEVYLAKKAEAEELRDAKAKKEHNQKILALIQEKKEGELKNKSIEELEALLK